MDFHRRLLARPGGRTDFRRLPESKWEERAAAQREARRMMARSRVLLGCPGETSLLMTAWWLSLLVDKESRLGTLQESSRSRRI